MKVSVATLLILALFGAPAAAQTQTQASSSPGRALEITAYSLHIAGVALLAMSNNVLGNEATGLCNPRTGACATLRTRNWAAVDAGVGLNLAGLIVNLVHHYKYNNVPTIVVGGHGVAVKKVWTF